MHRSRDGYGRAAGRSWPRSGRRGLPATRIRARGSRLARCRVQSCVTERTWRRLHSHNRRSEFLDPEKIHRFRRRLNDASEVAPAIAALQIVSRRVTGDRADLEDFFAARATRAIRRVESGFDLLTVAHREGAPIVNRLRWHSDSRLFFCESPNKQGV